MNISLGIVWICLGFVGLTWSANRLVDGAASIAQYYKISPLVIGMTIIGLGTSAPEIFVAISAGLSGNSGLAIGNALGSNIANIGLVLGVSALVSPLDIQSQTLRREYPILFIVMLMTWVLMVDGYLSRTDGVLLLIGLACVMVVLLYLAKTSRQDEPMLVEFKQELAPHLLPLKKAFINTAIGLIVLPLSAKVLVNGAVAIAHAFGISDIIIGLTIIAIGTSLPEIAASIAGTLKGEDDIAIGNILGSNIFNLLAVLPFPALLSPSPISSEIIWRDLSGMFLITALLFISGLGFKDRSRISRFEGALLLCAYISYLIVLANNVL